MPLKQRIYRYYRLHCIPESIDCLGWQSAVSAFEAWIAETVRREAVSKETQSEQELFDKIFAEAKRPDFSMNDYGSAVNSNIGLSA